MKNKDIIVVGASGGIGEAIVLELSRRYPDSRLWVTYNNTPIQKELEPLIYKKVKLDVCDQSSIEMFERKTSEIQNLTHLYSVLGVLSVDSNTPEKSLKDIQLSSLQRIFSINSFSAVIISSIFRKRLSKDASCRCVFLSAMVGSIEDNSMGGWYSYRASKTALNMFIKNISIEFERLGYQGKVLVIHPGTTLTKLSHKHLAHIKHKVWEPQGSAVNIINTALNTDHKSGSFLNWNGEVIPW